MATAIIGTIVIGSFVGVYYHMRKQKKKTGTSCSCSGCSGCANSSYCCKNT